MAYEKKVSRRNPGLIVAALDDSASMQGCLPGTSDPKFVWTQRYSGVILRELLSRSVDAVGKDAVVKPRYFLSVLLYGGTVQPWGQGIMEIGDAVDKYTRGGNSLGLGGKISATDTANAFTAAHAVLETAVADPKFKDSFPPILFHLTDGESQTDATESAARIRQLSTADGNVLVVNAYIGTETSLAYSGPEDFPGYVDPSEAGPREDNVRMFNMSSEVPETIRGYLVQEGIFPALREHSRLFFDVRTREMLKHCIQVVSSINANDVVR